MSLFWLTYRVSGGPVAVVIIEAPDPLQARFRAAVEGLDQANDAAECHQLEPDFAALILRNMIGRRLPVAEVAKLLRLLDRSAPIPKRPPARSIRRRRGRAKLSNRKSMRGVWGHSRISGPCSGRIR